MRLLVALLIVGVALAGCTDGPREFSSERLVIHINDVGGGYALGLPLWLAPGGVSADEWVNQLHIFSGSANLSVRQLDAGPALWIEGTGDVGLDAEDLRGFGNVERFLVGSYSLGTGPSGRPLMQLDRGDVDVTWQYAGKSPDCFLPLNHGWMADRPGHHTAQYGDRQDIAHDCVR